MADTTVRVILEEQGGAQSQPASNLPAFTQADIDKAGALQRQFIDAMLRSGQATMATPTPPSPAGGDTPTAPPLPQWLGGPGPPPIPKVPMATLVPDLPQWLGGPGPPPIPRLTAYKSPFSKAAKTLHYAGMPTLASASRAAGQLDEGAEGADAVIPKLMLVNAGAKLLTQAIETARAGIETVGHVTADAAKNNYMGALFASADAASGALKQIPVVGQAFGAAVDLTIAPVRAFTEVVSSFVERGREIARYSGPLAGAVAQADVRSLLADIRESQELGPGMASLTNETSQFYDDVRTALLPLKKALLDELVLEIRMIRVWLEKYPPEQVSEVTGHAAAASVSLFGIYELTKDMLGLGKKFEKKEDAKAIVGIIEDFYKIGDDKLPMPWGDQGAGGPLFPPKPGGPF